MDDISKSRREPDGTNEVYDVYFLDSALFAFKMKNAGENLL